MISLIGLLIVYGPAIVVTLFMLVFFVKAVGVFLQVFLFDRPNRRSER